MGDILTGVIIITIIGISSGVVLSIASVLMAVPKNKKAEALESALPGANCGACGFSGCSGYALAMAEGNAETGLCPPGGEDCMNACNAILGVSGTLVKKTAIVNCVGSYDVTDDKVEYDGIKSCSAAALLVGGVPSCRFGCLGMGDCERACPFNAVSVCNGVAIIDAKLCKACGKCIAVCPKKIIDMVPYKKQALIRCSNCDKGAGVVKICKVGCIGCMKCQKVCPTNAVTVTSFKASVNPELCVACGKCAQVCPRGIIDMFE